jgi:hypothetical protein|tara:strand:- start:2175 stop:2375 length:201 start_codon:yes stop_codon:yes gene_type:complete
MVTTKDEAMRLMIILLRYNSKKRARAILKAMNDEVGRFTDNKSLKNSLAMAYRLLGVNDRDVEREI